MLFLLGSIVFTSWLTLSFKLLERFRISSFQSIVFNYWTCVITGSFVNEAFPIQQSTFSENWFLWALLLGTIFIFLFNTIAFTAQQIGVAIASVANKLSLVIPFLFSIYLYNEKATFLKISGVAIAVLAVVLTCWPSQQNSKTNKSKTLLIIIPFLLFLGSGLLDTIIKYVEQAYLNESNKNEFLITTFAIAGFYGLVILLIRLLTGKEKFDGRSIVAGLLIGIPNYFSIWCLIKVLKIYSTNSSAIIPINNMGIVLFSSIIAWFFFKEKLSTKNWVGILFSLIAILLIAFG